MSGFSEARIEEIKTLVKRYPHPQSALLPVLHLAQHDFGYLSEATQKLVAETLGVSYTDVREVVTFYTMFRQQPSGKYRLEVCTNAGCLLNGAENLLLNLCKKLDIKLGETTPDGLFTVTEVECAGACGGAPVIQINNVYHEKVDEAHLETFIARARAGEAA